MVDSKRKFGRKKNHQSLLIEYAFQTVDVECDQFDFPLQSISSSQKWIDRCKWAMQYARSPMFRVWCRWWLLLFICILLFIVHIKRIFGFLRVPYAASVNCHRERVKANGRLRLTTTKNRLIHHLLTFCFHQNDGMFVVGFCFVWYSLYVMQFSQKLAVHNCYKTNTHVQFSSLSTIQIVRVFAPQHSQFSRFHFDLTFNSVRVCMHFTIKSAERLQHAIHYLSFSCYPLIWKHILHEQFSLS